MRAVPVADLMLPVGKKSNSKDWDFRFRRAATARMTRSSLAARLWWQPGFLFVQSRDLFKRHVNGVHGSARNALLLAVGKQWS